jgi:hypothetical protein
MALIPGFNPNGAHGKNSSLSAAVTLTIPSGSTSVLLQAFTQNVRITLDGTTPTASTGFQLKAADPAIMLPIGTGTVLKAIEETTSAVLNYQFGV